MMKGWKFMKKLVIYYSLEGNTKLISELISKAVHADVLALVPEKEIPKTGFKKFAWGGKSVLFHEKPKLINEEIDLSPYDVIFLGAPIWAGTYAAPFNTYLANCKMVDKKIALFACHAGSGADKCFKNFKTNLPNNHFIGEIDFVDPLKDKIEDTVLKVEKWINTLDLPIMHR